MKRLLGLGILSIGIFLCSCGRKRLPDSCVGAICTADFRMITVQIKDSVGADFVPDKVETYNSNAELINYQTTAAIPGQNVYTIVDDGDLNDLGVNIENEVTLKIIKNNAVIATQSFMVKADCCHVIKISGTDVIVVY